MWHSVHTASAARIPFNYHVLPGGKVVGERARRRGCCLFPFCAMYHNSEEMELSKLLFKFGMGALGGCQCSVPAPAQRESLRAVSARVAAINSLR